MDIRLVITNVGYIVGILLNLAIAFWVLRKGTNKVLSFTFALLNTALILFQIGHLLGINTDDSNLSRSFFTLTLAIIFIPPLSAHWVFGILGEEIKKRREVVVIYAFAFAIFIFYILWPAGYLNLSIPKLYLPNYYDAGLFFWLLPLYYVCVGAYFFSHLLTSYKTANIVLKNRLRYFMLTLVFGYGIGAIAFLLAFDIPADPMWSMFLSLYTIPLAYGIVRYELMDISVVAKRALVYGFFVALISLLITAVSYLNIVLSVRINNFPLWLLPLVSSFFAVAIGALVWLRLKEVDIIKYEFVTIITHKFRTPLTRIKWSSEELKKESLSEDGKYSLDHIVDAGKKLNDLTDMLASIADTERFDYEYKFSSVDFRQMVTDQLAQIRPKYKEKNIKLIENIAFGTFNIEADEKRVHFVIEVLLENALSYTPSGGSVILSLGKEGKKVFLSLRDTGMGISKEELSMISIKFFRNAKAKLADTEGLGIGLYLSKKVIDKHNGTIDVESEGEGKGTTFTIKFPLIK